MYNFAVDLNNLHIFIFFLAFEPFCFSSVRFLFIPLVPDKLHVRYDHTDDDTYIE